MASPSMEYKVSVDAHELYDNVNAPPSPEAPPRPRPSSSSVRGAAPPARPQSIKPQKPAAAASTAAPTSAPRKPRPAPRPTPAPRPQATTQQAPPRPSKTAPQEDGEQEESLLSYGFGAAMGSTPEEEAPPRPAVRFSESSEHADSSSDPTPVMTLQGASTGHSSDAAAAPPRPSKAGKPQAAPEASQAPPRPSKTGAPEPAVVALEADDAYCSMMAPDAGTTRHPRGYQNIVPAMPEAAPVATAATAEAASPPAHPYVNIVQAVAVAAPAVQQSVIVQASAEPTYTNVPAPAPAEVVEGFDEPTYTNMESPAKLAHPIAATHESWTLPQQPASPPVVSSPVAPTSPASGSGSGGSAEKKKKKKGVQWGAIPASTTKEEQAPPLITAVEDEGLYMNTKAEAEALVESLLDDDLYMNLPKDFQAPKGADPATEDLYMNYGNIADQLLDLKDDDEEGGIDIALPAKSEEQYTSLSAIKQHIASLGVDLGTGSVQPDGPKAGVDGKLGFSEESPIWELLRCSAFACLSPEFEKAFYLLKSSNTGDYYFEKATDIKRSVYLCVNVGDDVQKFAIKRLRGKAFLIFDSEYPSLCDLIHDLRSYGDEDIPVKLGNCCSALDSFIQKTVKKFFNNPDITQDTFNLKKLLLTLCSAMRDKFGKAAYIPYMPEFLEHAFLPAEKESLTLGPTMVAPAKPKPKPASLLKAGMSSTMPSGLDLSKAFSNFTMAGEAPARLAAAPESDEEEEAVSSPAPAPALSRSQPRAIPAGVTATLPKGFGLKPMSAPDSNPLSMDRSVVDGKADTMVARPPPAKVGYLQQRKLSKTFFKSVKKVWQRAWFELQGTDLVSRANGSFIYDDVLRVGTGTAIELEGKGKDVIAITNMQGRIHRFQAESTGEARTWVKALKAARKSTAQAVYADRDCLVVVVTKEEDGFGIEINFEEQKNCIVITGIRPNHAQALREGDIVLAMNEISFQGVGRDRALEMFVEAESGPSNFKITRPKAAVVAGPPRHENF